MKGEKSNLFKNIGLWAMRILLLAVAAFVAYFLIVHTKDMLQLFLLLIILLMAAVVAFHILAVLFYIFLVILAIVLLFSGAGWLLHLFG